MRLMDSQNTQPSHSTLELSRQMAFHEAGHAATIYLGNQRKQLPAIFFEIHINKSEFLNKPLLARIEGGRLVNDYAIQSTLTIFGHNERYETDSFKSAYEADMVNLMVGPLAEAKYVSIRDQETFSLDTLSPQCILNDGKDFESHPVWAYLECFPSSQLRDSKLTQLFAEAFHFVQQPHSWQKITGLAHYLLQSNESIISCEQACHILDNRYPYSSIDWL